MNLPPKNSLLPKLWKTWCWEEYLRPGFPGGSPFGKTGEYVWFMDMFAPAADMLGFIDGKKNPGHSEERAWPDENLLALFRWILSHRVKKAKMDRISMKDFLAHYHQRAGRKSVPVPAAASLKEPCEICCFHLTRSSSGANGNRNKRRWHGCWIYSIRESSWHKGGCTKGQGLPAQLWMGSFGCAMVTAKWRGVVNTALWDCWMPCTMCSNTAGKWEGKIQSWWGREGDRGCCVCRFHSLSEDCSWENKGLRWYQQVVSPLAEHVIGKDVPREWGTLTFLSLSPISPVIELELPKLSSAVTMKFCILYFILIPGR